MSSHILSCASYLPGDAIDNHQLESIFNLKAEWIELFLNNKTRHYAFDPKTTLQTENLIDLCEKASRGALAKLPADNITIDAIILATATPHYLMPATVNLVADRLGLNHIATYQIQSGCLGAIQALALADALLQQNDIDHVLVVGGDICYRHMDFNIDITQATSQELINYALFGDGAGAAILANQASHNSLKLTSVINRFIGLGQEPGQLINWQGVNTQNEEMVHEDYKAIEEKVPQLTADMLDELMTAHQLELADIDYIMPPQLSGKMTDYIIAKNNIPLDKCINCIAETGNNGNALPFLQLERLLAMNDPTLTAIGIAIESSKWLKGGIVING